MEIRLFQSDSQQVEKGCDAAKAKLMRSYPKLSKMVESIYNLKRNIILLLVFVVFNTLIQLN